MTEGDRWAAVGAAVRQRLQQLAWRQADLIRESGLSDMTIRPFEAGEANNSRPATRAKVAKALGWPADGIDRILAGEDPATFAPGTVIAPPEERWIDASMLSEEDREAVKRIVEGLKQQR